MHFHRRHQPPIDVAGRRTESRHPWWGLALLLVGLALFLGGIKVVRSIPDSRQEQWRESELVQAVRTDTVKAPATQPAGGSAAAANSAEPACPT